MNVKCPNCRFKFDVNPADVNEYNCICPRCGKAVTVVEQKMGAEDVKPQLPEPQGSEAEMFFAAKALMDDGRYQEARAYITKLLEMSPDEALYSEFKEELDIIDEQRRHVQQTYSQAVEYIKTGQTELAEPLVDELLQMHPDEPLYQSVKRRLEDKKHQVAQQAQLELLKEEARRRKQKEKAGQQIEPQQQIETQDPQVNNANGQTDQDSDLEWRLSDKIAIIILIILLMVWMSTCAF